ncbi:GtrA family protein [Sphingobacterium daejeonense]|jgi:putative flippase GtrA|uniref:GtrA family protein n=1 Tax=Sphingobacterium daejeonense TaxID=371142 RepID=A0ABW3RRB5_9SPHI|nr:MULTISPECIES: GtrA family protein [Sphingobacterium]MCT1530956.1 GtrA family protein [Sphingobacterium daejeonense]
MITLLTLAVRFAAVGLLGMVIDFIITWFLKEKIDIEKFVANTIGFIIAVCNNYILNRIWTFNSKNPNVIEQFYHFATVSIIGLLLNTVFLYILHEKFNMKFYSSKFLAILMTFGWNFLANLLYTFGNV